MQNRPAKTREQVLRDFRTDQILEAARRVIGEVGFAEASIDRIAEAAGVARSTLYVYFDGKEDLLNQCIAQLRLGLGERVRQAVEEASGTEERLAAFLASHFEYVGKVREFFRAVMAVRGVDPFFSPPGGGTPPELETIRAESGAVVEAILKDAVASGEIPAENLPAALELLAVLIYGALMRRAQQAEPGPAGPEAQRLAAAFLWGVAGR
jgi:TetR/AcrR family fatty acid metabolism transcriptional regulator